ncbi:MAG: NUDIX domain-containing protein [Armatimonadota bacterium]
MPPRERPQLSSLRIDELDDAAGYMMTGLGLMHRQGRVLLVLPGSDRRWRLPGGVVRRMETPADAVRRSIRSTTGVSVTVASFLGVAHNPCECSVELMFEVRPYEGCQACLDHDHILHAVWFPMNALPANCCEGTCSAITAFLEAGRSPFLVTHRGGERGIWQS